MEGVFIGAGIAVLIGILTWAFNHGKNIGRFLLAFVGCMLVVFLGGLIVGFAWAEFGETIGIIAFFVILGGGFSLVFKLTGFQK